MEKMFKLKLHRNREASCLITWAFFDCTNDCCGCEVSFRGCRYWWIWETMRQYFILRLCFWFDVGKLKSRSTTSHSFAGLEYRMSISIRCWWIFCNETVHVAPFSGRELNDSRRIFNYRPSRVRRVVENAFGILSVRWRIYQRCIDAGPEHVDDMIKATIVLPNFCILLCRSWKLCIWKCFSGSFEFLFSFSSKHSKQVYWLLYYWRRQSSMASKLTTKQSDLTYLRV